MQCKKKYEDHQLLPFIKISSGLGTDRLRGLTKAVLLQWRGKRMASLLHVFILGGVIRSSRGDTMDVLELRGSPCYTRFSFICLGATMSMIQPNVRGDMILDFSYSSGTYNFKSSSLSVLSRACGWVPPSWDGIAIIRVYPQIHSDR